MKQKNYIIKLLLKTWLGILCFSLLCTFCAVWLLFQNTKQSSFDNINIVYEGIFLTWAIIGVIMFSVGTFTLFLNYFPVIRYNNIYSFLSFFLVPLGLQADDEFWSAKPEKWSSVKIWSGSRDIKKDGSIRN